MNSSGRSFDRLARVYRALEFLAFGRDLERARFCLLPHLKPCRTILVLGEGDGRCLEQLLALNPSASIDCLDLSAAMLDRARRRLGARASRVNFIHADVLATELPARHYDAVVTCFFLDCFDDGQAQTLVTHIAASLQPHALWLWADFVLPAHGPARWRAQVWLVLLFGFFRWQTGLKNNALPHSEKLIEAAGFDSIAMQTRQWGLLRSRVYRFTAI